MAVNIPTGSHESSAAEAIILNRLGLHARPVIEFVDIARRYQSEIVVSIKTDKTAELVDGKSYQQLLWLRATRGQVLRITAYGPDSKEAVRELKAIIERGFDEEI